MRLRSLALGLAACLLALPAWPQGNPTGTLSGRVVDAQGLPLPGVTVAVESPSLQGRRTTVTSANGDYIFALLPPGTYTASFELTGFRTVKQTVKVGATESIPLGATLSVAAVTEEITVVAPAEPFQQSGPASSNYNHELISTLPLNRTVNALTNAALLAPGVEATGPNGGLTINGAMSFENLFLVDGVVVNENIRGQARTLFIDDALQEATINRSGISAEYGRFQGGVVTALTKSGGNEFSGSFRTTFTNDNWRSITPYPNDTKTNKVVPIYEATLGGPVVRDKVWFFGAGRLRDNAETRQTRFTNLAYDFGDNEKRYEGKITVTPVQNHTLRATYIDVSHVIDNNSFNTIMDLKSLYTQKQPENLLSVNYTAALSSNFSLDAQYSRRKFTFSGGGAPTTDLIQGTLLLDRQRNNARYWSPTFCGVCDDEHRDNQNLLVKGNYFVSTGSTGSHNLVFGIDSFNDQRFANNHQSGSDYRVFGTTSVIQGSNVFPVFNNDNSTFIRWTPIFQGSQGTNFKSYAGFVNDTWRYNSHLTLNLGLRYDKNNGENSNGTKVVKDSNISPRIGVTYDPIGDGQWTLNASYGKYVAAIANGIADGSSSGGQPATIDFTYLGPAINTNPAGPFIPTDQALQMLFNWFQNNGGTARTTRGAPSLPGVNTSIGDGLKSPNVVEYSVGFSRKLGNKGLFRLDGVHRSFRDFYSTLTDLSTGKVTDARLAQFGLVPTGRSFDLQVTENTNKGERSYNGIEFQLNYRFSTKFDMGANYTLSETKGNVVGETGPSGPVTQAFDFYPEYRNPAWNAPIGDLVTDSRHKLRAWGNWTVPVPAAIGNVNLGILERFNSGTPYDADGLVDTRPYVANPGYISPPATVTYFFTARDAFRTANYWETDLALNYSLRLAGMGKRTELIAQGQVLNLFNGQALSNYFDGNCGTGGCISVSVLTNNNNTKYAAFNPFTTQPVEGVNWAKGTDFGTALSRFAYQTPRTFQFAVGFRF
jgi:outer membrane receptor for ferrienterochelin and colicin